MKTHALAAEKRDVVGKKVKKLRKQGLIPANIYGKGVASASISVKHDDFVKTYQETGETGLIEITIKGQKEPHHVLVHNVQIHAVSDEIIHADFHQVALKEKIRVPVPLTFTGESPATSQKIGILLTLLNEVEVEALPTELPEEITVDISSLAEIGDEIKISDVKVDSKVKIIAEPNDVVVKINPLEKVEEPVAPAPTEGEAAAEGAAPTDGTEPKAEPAAKTPAENTKE